MIYSPAQRLDPVLARYFTHREVARSQLATRLGIDNTPPPQVLERARVLAMSILEPIRDECNRGFSPSSWYRSEALERALCQRPYERWCSRKGMPVDDTSWAAYFARKQHPTGMAADIEVPGLSNDKLYDWIKRNLTFDQLIREFPKPGYPMSGWVHVSYNAEENRQQAFTIG